jgi:SAM-dependent methyltransferase
MKLTHMRFQLTPMEEIPFPDQNFDAVTCRYGLMHAADAMAGLRHARRVLRPGKKAAFMVHGPAHRNHIWSTLHSTAAEFFGIDNKPRIATHFRYSGEGELSALMNEAGFMLVTEKEISDVQVKKKSGKLWTPALQRGYGERLGKLDEAELARLDQAMEAAFEEFLDGDDYHLRSAQIIGWGQA